MLRLSLLLLLLGCGPERELSGIWQQRCESGECGLYLYELHLGRYGDELSGLIIRYRAQGSEAESFAKSLECGCFFMESGKIKEGMLLFGLYRAEEPGAPEHPEAPCLEPEPEPCTERFFKLESEGELLKGVLSCDRSEEPVEFLRARGSTRADCRQLP